MRALLCDAALLFALLLVPVAAAAEDAPPVRVLLPPCASFAFDPTVLLDVLRVELGPGEAAADVVLTAEPRGCDSTLVRIRIEDRASGRHTEEEVELADIPGGDRARVLALAMAELLRAPFDPEPEPEPGPAQVSEVVEPVPAGPQVDRDALVRVVREAAREEAREVLGRGPAEVAPPPGHTLWLGGAVGQRLAPEVRGTMTDVRLLALVEPAGAPALQIGLELGVGVGGGLDELGRVLTVSPGAALRVAWVARPSEPVAASVGLRGAFGWAWAFGQGSREAIVEDSMNGATVDVEAFATVLLRMAARVRLVVDLRLGYGVVPFVPDAAGRAVGGLSGPGIALGIGVVAGLREHRH